MIRALLLLFIVTPAVSWGASSTTVAGTGITFSLPPSFARAPVGPFFMDSSGQTFIQIMVGRKEHAVENGRLFRSIYPVGPTTVENGTTQGRLYKRTRAEHGGGWDGWSYNVLGSESALSIGIMYTGSDERWFESLREFFRTIKWDERKIDSELSFGARFDVVGLKLVPRQVGGILYTPNGEPGTPSPSLLIQALPIPPSNAGSVFPAACAAGTEKVFLGEPYIGPTMFEANGISGCDAWSSLPSDKMVYVVIFRTADGAVLSGLGSMPAENAEKLRSVFRNAVTGMTRVPQRAAQQQVQGPTSPPSAGPRP